MELIMNRFFNRKEDTTPANTNEDLNNAKKEFNQMKNELAVNVKNVSEKASLVLGISNLSDRLDTIEERLENLGGLEGLEGLEDKMDTDIEKKLSALDAKLSALDANIEGRIDSRIEGLMKKFGSFFNKGANCPQGYIRLDDLAKRLSKKYGIVNSKVLYEAIKVGCPDSCHGMRPVYCNEKVATEYALDFYNSCQPANKINLYSNPDFLYGNFRVVDYYKK